MKKIITMATMLSGVITYAQETQGRVGINTENPRATLDIHRNTLNDQNRTFAQGVSFPNFTTDERAQFRNVLKGTMIYNTTKSCVEICTGTENDIPQWSCMSDVRNITNTLSNINSWEYLVITYKASSTTSRGLDIDSRTWWISGGATHQPVGCGYSDINQVVNALNWGGDDRTRGSESVLISKQDLIQMFLLNGTKSAELRLDLHLWEGSVNELEIDIDILPVGSPRPVLNNNVFTSPIKLNQNFTTNKFTWNGIYNMVNSYPSGPYSNTLATRTGALCGWSRLGATAKDYPFSNTKFLLFDYNPSTGDVIVTPKL